MKKLLLKLSLMQKVVILTVISGLIGWIVLDQVQTSRVNKILDEELSKKLSKQSALERMRFDKHIKDFSRGLKIIASHENFYRYINRKDVFFNKEVITHKSPPKWLPRLSIIRSLIQPRTILMYNNKGVLKEIFQSRNEYTPGSIVNNPQRLLSLGHEQSYITMIERTPYIITSEKVHNNRNNHVATLMLLSPVDDEFMIASQGISGSSIVALLSDDSSTILTSNNYVELPPGTPLDKINDKFISVGESFFDYGSSSFPIRFISFRSSKEVDELTKSVMVSVRREGIIVSFTFIACFMFVMVLFTRRVEGLGEKVAKFSRDTLNVKDIKSYKGDQLFVLEKRFSDLIDEVIESRNRTRNDAAEKILLVRKNIEEKEKQLDMLQIATEKFGVGIILKINNEYTPANEQMKKIVLECGDVKQFIPAAGVSSEEIYFCNDDDGNERVFDTRMLEYTSGESEIYLVQEITEIKNKTKELEHLALHDSLTALPNRTLLQERLIQALSVAQREYKMVALFMMDLDRFKEVNDTLGHHYGDLLLKEVAKRLRYTLRDSDTVARFGGDEFSVLLTVNNEEVALKVAKKIIAAIDREFVLEGHSISTEISIGIAMFPEHGEDPNILLKRADVAMYVAKSTRTGFTFYDPRQDPHSLNRLSLMADLRHAIENDELVAYYQPKIDIKTGKVSSAEALIRWHHPVEGAVSPDLFVPIAEQTGLMKQLTYWVVDKAIHQCARWHRTGLNIDISINLSARNLQDDNLAGYISNLLKNASVRPEWITFEITESTIMASPTDARKTLLELDKMGVGISIDDFGTGHSSLAYIKRLPVSEIKIDKSFVIDMNENENDAVIVRATIDLAHNLGLKVIAEGVETREAFDTLEILGCDMAQGYLFSPAMPEDKFIHWYNTSPWGGSDGLIDTSGKIRRIK